MDAAHLRRPRLLRRDRRSRLQADLPGAAGAGARRRPQRPDRRRRQVRLGPRTVSGARQGQSRTSRQLRRRRLRAPRRAAELCRRRLQRSANVRAPASRRSARAKRPLHYLAIPPVAVRRGRVGARRERAQPERAPRGREAVRPRPRSAQRARPDAAQAFSRRGDLPHRPLSRQGAGAEHPLHALRQRDFRAALEPATMSAASRSPWRRISASRPRQLLRRDRRAARRGSEPSAAGRRQPDDGSADRRGCTRPSAIRRRRC